MSLEIRILSNLLSVVQTCSFSQPTFIFKKNLPLCCCEFLMAFSWFERDKTLYNTLFFQYTAYNSPCLKRIVIIILWTLNTDTKNDIDLLCKRINSSCCRPLHCPSDSVWQPLYFNCLWQIYIILFAAASPHKMVNSHLYLYKT